MFMNINFFGAGRIAGGGRAEPLSGVISRLTAGWQEGYDAWQRRDLLARRYVYIWADGVYLCC